MGKIDTTGTYLVDVVESGLAVSSGGYPQWVARLKAVQKWVDSKEEMQHFNLSEPGYVDWSGYDEEINSYLVLFKDKETFNKETSLLNYEQLQLALGWDGTEFDSLGDGSHVGKRIMARINEEEYQGKTSIKVVWIDSKDADTTRALKTLNTAEVKNLSAKLKAGGLGKAAKPAAPAKPVTPAKPATHDAAPAAKPPVTAAPAAASTTPPATTAAAKPKSGKKADAPAPTPAPAAETPAPKGPPASKKKAATPPPPAEETPAAPLPSTSTKLEAWDYVNSIKGETSDGDIEETWMSMCGEVLGEKNEDDATPQEWAKVRDLVIKDLDLA